MAIVIGIKMYIAHVGDSGIVMGFDDDGMINCDILTTEHKPDSSPERKRIERDGGLVMTKNGVHRVVWKRPKISHQGPVRRSTNIDYIPFLAVARSLGDLWSYDFESKKYIISPEPDVHVFTLDPYEHKFLVIGSDGLWNMIRGPLSVDIVADYERERIKRGGEHPTTAANVVVKAAIKQWNDRFLRADNTTSIVVFIDPMATVETPRTSAGKFHRNGTWNYWDPPYSDLELYGYVYHRPSVLLAMNRSNSSDTSVVDTPKVIDTPKVSDTPSLKRSHAFNSELPIELSPKKMKMSPCPAKKVCQNCYGYKLLDDDQIEVTVKPTKKQRKRMKRKPGINGLVKKMTPMCVTKVIIPSKYKSQNGGYSSPHRRCYGEAAYVKVKVEESPKPNFQQKIIIPTKFKTPGLIGKDVRRRCFSAEPVITTKILSATKLISTPNLASPTPDKGNSTSELRIPLAVKRLKTEQNNQLPETPKHCRKVNGKVLPSSYTLRRRSDTDLLRQKMVTRARSKVIPQIKRTRSKSKLTPIKTNVGKAKVAA